MSVSNYSLPTGGFYVVTCMETNSKQLLWFHPDPLRNKREDLSTAADISLSSERVWWGMKISDHLAYVCAGLPKHTKTKISTTNHVKTTITIND